VARTGSRRARWKALRPDGGSDAGGSSGAAL
jgi:hypothetical protein